MCLAVHAVSHAAMARDGVAKVLDLEAALEAGSEEAAKGCDDRCKHRQHHGMQLHVHMLSQPSRKTLPCHHDNLHPVYAREQS